MRRIEVGWVPTDVLDPKLRGRSEGTRLNRGTDVVISAAPTGGIVKSPAAAWLGELTVAHVVGKANDPGGARAATAVAIGCGRRASFTSAKPKVACVRTAYG
jgi:hypothetical protein